MSYVRNMETFDEIIEELYNDLDSQIDELKQAKNKKDMKNYAILVHGLKSNYRSLGMTEFTERAYEHEMESKKNNTDFIVSHFDELVKDKQKAKSIINKYLKLK